MVPNNIQVIVRALQVHFNTAAGNPRKVVAPSYRMTTYYYYYYYGDMAQKFGVA